MSEGDRSIQKHIDKMIHPNKKSFRDKIANFIINELEEIYSEGINLNDYIADEDSIEDVNSYEGDIFKHVVSNNTKEIIRLQVSQLFAVLYYYGYSLP